MEDQENQRAAANIQANISSQLFAASLVLMGILIGLIDIKEIPLLSSNGILILISLSFLLISLFMAGIGLKRLRNNGVVGDWKLTNLHIFFRLQTLCNIISIFLFFWMLIGTNNETNQDFLQNRKIELIQKSLKYDSMLYLQGKVYIDLLKSNSSKIDSINQKLLNKHKP